MKIAITGSHGFVGGYIVNFFSKQHNIIAFQRQENKINGNINFIKWDLNDEYDQEFDCDIFIHCASDVGYTKSKEELIQNNVLSNKNIIQLIHKSQCKHFIYISSSSVYQGIFGKIDETVKIKKENLTNSYSMSKYLAEEYLIDNLNKNIKLSILRPRAIYGKGDKVLVPNILKYQLFKRLLLIGNGKNKTSLTDVNFFVKFIDNVIKNQISFFQVYNVFDPKTKTMEEIYQEIVKEYHLKGIIKIPLFLLKLLRFMNKNKIDYLIDSFENDKILVNINNNKKGKK